MSLIEIDPAASASKAAVGVNHIANDVRFKRCQNDVADVARACQSS